jgi:hypothetical protein
MISFVNPTKFSIRDFVLYGVLGPMLFSGNPVDPFPPDETDIMSSIDSPSPMQKTINDTVEIVSSNDRVAVWQGMQIMLFEGSTMAEAPTELPLV